MNEYSYNALRYLQFTTLQNAPVLQAVFTRLGGVSEPPYDGLNIGSTVGDKVESVERNRGLMLAALGLTPDQVVTARQVHGKRVVRVDSSSGASAVPECDGLITNDPGLFLLMRFADCVPVLLYDPVRHAVGLVHAGWQGTLKQVSAAVVEAMGLEFGTSPQDIRAGIGPSIGPCCLEVGSEVVAQVRASLPDADALLSRSQPNGHAYLDIWQANSGQLQRAGVQDIELAGCCTCCHQELFYSHRGSHGITGRFGALIGLR